MITGKGASIPVIAAHLAINADIIVCYISITQIIRKRKIEIKNIDKKKQKASRKGLFWCPLYESNAHALVRSQAVYPLA